jgi:hypothetical protein
MFRWPCILYNLGNRANLTHNLFLVYLFLVYLSIYTCFGRLCAYHQEKQLCLCDFGTCYSVWMTVWYTVWKENGKINFIPPCVPDRHSHKIKSTKFRINTVISPDDGHIVARNIYRLINILRINTLRINCESSWHYFQDYTECTANKT